MWTHLSGHDFLVFDRTTASLQTTIGRKPVRNKERERRGAATTTLRWLDPDSTSTPKRQRELVREHCVRKRRHCRGDDGDGCAEEDVQQQSDERLFETPRERDPGQQQVLLSPHCPRGVKVLLPPSVHIVALDCEMVGIRHPNFPGREVSALARASLVDFDGAVLWSNYVRPKHPIINYRTKWSGIRPHHLREAVPFDRARAELTQLIRDCILVGHGLTNDLAVLEVQHPRDLIRDTADYLPLQRTLGLDRPPSLRLLASHFLNLQIQADARGHCPTEDALAALLVYKKFQRRWELGLSLRHIVDIDGAS
eukprot:gnl/Spiro4/10382_TR5550_c0_g1_i1.p1 gnl/Spiro4/10382_TR5550_c0_g1~~gnl/Spiro4/10382_TR5550_c0_g1_i1.p1  ORF type:complete len:338 (+),score=101.52 gnl/Spiro4/10382_TR5550_c0_g1_i1:87-1016(+)